MNTKTKVSLAAVAVLLTGAAMASAANCPIGVGSGVPIAPQASPLSCTLPSNGGIATAQAFGIVGSLVGANMIGDANFADTFGYTSTGSKISGCHAIDPTVSGAVNRLDATGCGSATKQDLFLSPI